MNPSSRWGDLWLRVITGVALVALGGTVLWFGGAAFAILVALVTGVMIWELACMVSGNQGPRPLQLGVLTTACVLFARQLDPSFAAALLAAPPVVGAALLPHHRQMFAISAFCIVVAGYGLVGFRENQGALLTVWLVGVVVATDIAGYFGGRAIGGRKFWPRVSPGKTWAGIFAGWLAAALVGLAFAPHVSIGPDLMWMSVAASFAGQCGDLAESAVKRRIGVKDSGGILPGHGGFLDRFDGLVGATLLIALVPVIGHLASA